MGGKRTAKVAVKGPNAHPFYKWAAAERPADLPGWNFHKYLIDRSGKVVGSFASQVEPQDKAVVGAIEKALAAGK